MAQAKASNSAQGTTDTDCANGKNSTGSTNNPTGLYNTSDTGERAVPAGGSAPRTALQPVIESAFQSALQSVVQRDPNVYNAYLLVHSAKLGIHAELAAGQSGAMPADPRQPFYIASITKLFTATLIGMLASQGKLRFHDPIADYVDTSILTGLHVIGGHDYAPDIQIHHLLNHTSGLSDYFEEKPQSGPPIISQMLAEPERIWTPTELFAWSKQHLKPHSAPGQRLHYSENGYNLLGLAIERLTGLPLPEAFKQFIFEPLGMQHSWFVHGGTPLDPSHPPLAQLYYGSRNVAGMPSLSISFAGGGIASTAPDLLLFMQALATGRLLDPSMLATMRQHAVKFVPGIRYGYGVMDIVGIPLLMPARIRCWGNAGSTGTFLFYHPRTDSILAGALNQFRYHAKGIRFMLKLVHQLDKLAAKQSPGS